MFDHPRRVLRLNHPLAARVPPSTGIVCPVTNRASSEARNATTSAQSAGRPKRPRGIHDARRAGSRPSSIASAEVWGVSVRSGAIAFTRTPLGPSSTASDLVNAETAALYPEYTV